MKALDRTQRRAKRHRRVRRKVAGSAERPRMSIMRSNRYMYVQFIDDEAGLTLAAASTHGNDGANNLAAADDLGTRAAAAAVEKGISRIVVDRGGFRYHGRVKALVEAAVKGGLSISDEAQPPASSHSESGGDEVEEGSKEDK